ncbi:hypothetical protein [Natribaculum luteum]|uniref:hypothetical protein n=1 Tax=Natribaculum luteum TaxID=1586232 RepID=UPI001FF321A4|nr:hypothetical protein [Natribaculum luteum]
MVGVTTSRERLERRGWDVVYVPHAEIEAYNACYRVEYDGERIYPPAADDLEIPLDEIWISERWRPYERFVLYHELREIEYRARGDSVEEAHRNAERDELALWRHNPRWKQMNEAFGVGREHLSHPTD